MKLTEKIRLTKNNIITTAMAIFILAAGIFMPFSAYAAAGDSYFGLSPTSGSYTVGNSLVVSLSETSTSGDNTNAVQANLSYPTSLLQFSSISLDGPFTLCGQQTGGSGAVNIACASTTAESGTSQVAQITFSVLAAGTASVAMTSGSDIDNTSGNSVFNGNLPSASYTLSKPAVVTTPAPVTTPTKTPVSNPTTTKPTTTTTPVKTPTPTVAPSTVTPLPATTVAPSLASLSVTVVTSKGKAIKDVKVILDKTHSALTNTNGIANFSGITSGSYTVTATKAGQKTIVSKLVLTPGENKILRLVEASTSSNIKLLIFIIIGLIIIAGLIVGGSYLKKFMDKTKTATPAEVTTHSPTPTNLAEDSIVFPSANIISPEPVKQPEVTVPEASPVAAPDTASNLFPSPAPPTVITPQTTTPTPVEPVVSPVAEPAVAPNQTITPPTQPLV